MEMSFEQNESISNTYLLIKINEKKVFFFIALFCFSSRPGRPPKRNSAHQIDDCLDDKRMKLSSSILLRSFPDFANQSKIKNPPKRKENESFFK
jgi:hypothetical protein